MSIRILKASIACDNLYDADGWALHIELWRFVFQFQVGFRRKKY